MTNEEIEAARAKNPFSKAFYNLTRQMVIASENPELAIELKTAARPVLAVNNPWLKESFNLTAQFGIRERSPEAADKLKEMAIAYERRVSTAKDLSEIATARGTLIEDFAMLSDDLKNVVSSVMQEWANQEHANTVTAAIMGL